MIRQRGLGIWMGLLLVLLFPVLAGAQSGADGSWAVVTKRAACTSGPRVLLGEIAEPYGHVPDGVWSRMSQTELWESPASGSRPTTYSARELDELLTRHLGASMYAVRISGQLSLQRGGQLLDAAEIERRVVGFLTPRLAAKGGEITLRNVSVPLYVFLDNDFHSLDIEPQGGIDAGRVALKLTAKTIDGRILRRFAVSLFVDRWISVPSAARPVNSGEILTPRYDHLSAQECSLPRRRSLGRPGRSVDCQSVHGAGHGYLQRQFARSVAHIQGRQGGAAFQGQARSAYHRGRGVGRRRAGRCHFGT